MVFVSFLMGVIITFIWISSENKWETFLRNSYSAGISLYNNIKFQYFGEQTTSGGIIIANDDGKTRGIYPRWGKVYAKGPENKDEYNVGDWILIEHGRWTRAMKIKPDDDTEEFELRMVEAESILAVSDTKPDGAVIGKEYADGEHATVDPSSFVRN